MNSEIMLYVLIGFLLLMVLLILPLLYQLWRTAEQLTITLRSLNQRLPSILQNLEEITISVSEASRNANARITELSLAFQRVHAFLNTIHGVQQVMQSQIRFPVVRMCQNAVPLFKGVKTFLSVLKSKGGNPG